MAAARTSYDVMPYPRLSHVQTHPDRLATLATLLGLYPAAPDHCRVLELGCASGGNILPMAYVLRDSRFVGIDASSVEVDDGRADAAALGLTNVQLMNMDILATGADLGQFDYIIAHGIFSWVPREVQNKILDICRRHLAPQGVAYISYNVLPGWRLKGIVRDAMRFHTRKLADPRQRVSEARKIPAFLAQASAENPLAGYFKAYAEALQEKSGGAEPVTIIEDALVLYDDLAEFNEPVYFHEFIAQAVAHELQYLAEADFQDVFLDKLAPEARQALQQMAGDIVELEQYLDFLRLRMFRQTLLCRAGLGVQRSFGPLAARPFLFTSQSAPESETPDIRGPSVEKFSSPFGATLAIDHPVSKAALQYLGEIWPRPASFASLLEAACSRLGLSKEAAPGDGEKDAQILGANLLKGYTYSRDLVDLHLVAPSLSTDGGDRPLASAVARLQARTSATVANLWHERLALEDPTRYVLLMLDGKLDRGAIVDHLSDLAQRGEIALAHPGAALTPGETRQSLAEDLERQLAFLAHNALLLNT